MPAFPHHVYFFRAENSLSERLFRALVVHTDTMCMRITFSYLCANGQQRAAIAVVLSSLKAKKSTERDEVVINCQRKPTTEILGTRDFAEKERIQRILSLGQRTGRNCMDGDRYHEDFRMSAEKLEHVPYSALSAQ